MATTDVNFILTNSKNGQEHWFTVNKNAAICIGNNNSDKFHTTLYYTDGLKCMYVNDEYYRDNNVGRCQIDAKSYNILTKIIGDNKLTESDLLNIQSLEGKYGIKKVYASDPKYGNVKILTDDGKTLYIDIETDFETKQRNAEQEQRTKRDIPTSDVDNNKDSFVWWNPLTWF